LPPFEPALFAIFRSRANVRSSGGSALPPMLAISRRRSGGIVARPFGMILQAKKRKCQLLAELRQFALNCLQSTRCCQS
jgi:hypothetical protein